MNTHDVINLDLQITYGDLTDAIEGFNLLLTEGYMAHGEDFNCPEFHLQVRAATYLMGLVRRGMIDALNAPPQT